MKRILHLIDVPGPGGAETVFLDLVRGLDRSEWQSVAMVPWSGWLSDRLLRFGTEVHFGRASTMLDLRHYRAGARLVRERGIDLIHAHLLGASLSAGVIGLLSRTPVVATIHGHVDLSPTERFRAAKLALLKRGVARLVFVSDPLRRWFVDETRYPCAATAVVPNGIRAQEYAPGQESALRAEFGAGEGDFLVGAVGNFREAKAFDVLLRAAAALKSRGSGYRFVIVGQTDGPVYERLVRMRRELGLESDVMFAGFREDVPRVLRSLDAYVLTSRQEGFSLSTVQAMATGLPVVATRCGGPEAIVEHERTGLLVPTNAPGEVATALERLRGSPGDRERLGREARRDALEHFSVDVQVRAYECVYDEVLAAASRSRRWRRRSRADGGSVAPGPSPHLS